MFEYTELEEWQGTYSDMFKDVHGFRPRNVCDECWNSVGWLKTEVSRLGAELDLILIEERKEEERAIAEFEARVDEIINTGAGDRATALRWLFDAEGDDYARCDRDYYCYLHGLPYGYFKEAA